MVNLPWTSMFTEEELYRMQIDAVSTFMRCDKPESVEATIELARVLNEQGLDSQNYPLVLELLRQEHFKVVEALLQNEAPFDYFKKVQLNRYTVDFCLRVLYTYTPGNVYEKTLEMILGILYRTYHSPKEGNLLRRLTIEDINAIGKFLDKTKNQRDPVNRFILDILGDLGGFTSINNEDPDIDRVSAHAIAIRNAFFDRTERMDSVMPPEILVRDDYRRTAVMPRDVIPVDE